MATLVASYTDSAGTVDSPSTDNLVTSTFTPVNGEVIIVKLSTWSQFQTQNAPTATGLTFTQRVRYVPSTDHCFIAIYSAIVSGSPTNISVTSVHNGNESIHAMCVERWSQAKLAASPLTLRAEGDSGAPNHNFTTTAANSKISALVGDWNGQSGTATYRGTSTQNFAYRQSSLFNFFSWYQSVASASTVAVGMTAPTGQHYQIAAIEILDASAIEEDLGLAQESDSAKALSRRKRKVLGLVTGLSAIKSLAKQKTHALHVQEFTSALSVGKSKLLVVDAIHGTDSALALREMKSHLLGVEGETQLVHSLDGAKTKGLATVNTLDSLLDLKSSKVLGLGNLSDSALVNELSRVKTQGVGPITETGSALGTDRLKRRAVSHAESMEAVSGVSRSKAIGLGLLGGSQTIHQLNRAKSLMLSLLAEDDVVQELGIDKSRLLGVVHEIDTALSLGGTLGLVSETSAVHGLSRRKSRTMELASEQGQTYSVGKAKSLALSQASEVSEVLELSVSKLLAIGKLLETNSLEMLVSKKGKLLELLVDKSLAHTMTSDQVIVDRSGPLTDITSLMMSRYNMWRRG